MSTPPNGDKDVLHNLPRSRPGRSTARREAARAKRNGTAPATAAKSSRAKRPSPRVTAAAPETAAKPAAVRTVPKAAPVAGNKRPARLPAPVSKAAAIKTPRNPPNTAKPKRPAPKLKNTGVVPPAGYAVPTDGHHGSADPAGALVKLADVGASFLRGVLNRLPG